MSLLQYEFIILKLILHQALPGQNFPLEEEEYQGETFGVLQET